MLGLVFVLAAAMVLSSAVAYFLSTALELPFWIGFGIVGLTWLVAGLCLILTGKKRFDSFNPLPDKTVQSVKEKEFYRSGLLSSEKRSESSPFEGCSVRASTGESVRGAACSLNTGSFAAPRCELAPRQRSSTALTKSISSEGHEGEQVRGGPRPPSARAPGRGRWRAAS